MSFYTHDADKKSGDGLALTDWNNLSSAIAGNQGLTLALDQNHKLGIGVTQPSEKLEVDGKVKATHFIGDGSQLTNVTVDLQQGLHFATESGNVGIGTTNPEEKLHVNGDVLIGKADEGILKIGYVGHQNFPGIAHKDCANGSDYALLQHKGGSTYLNSRSGQGLYFRQGNVSKMVIHKGNVGIGTQTPEAALSVAGGGKKNWPNSNMHITNDCILFGGSNSGKGGDSAQISAGMHKTNSLNIVGMTSNGDGNTRKIDCWAEGGFAIHGFGNSFTISSDGHRIFFHMLNSEHGPKRRISWNGDTNWDWASDRNAKTDIESEPDILERLVQLDVKNFRWKGTPESARKTIGLIAQDVQPLFPSLVSEVSVPDGEGKQLTLKLGAFGVLAVGAIKELKAEIDALKAQMEPLAS